MGILLKWNYKKHYVDISMPGCVDKLTQFFKLSFKQVIWQLYSEINTGYTKESVDTKVEAARTSHGKDSLGIDE